MPIFQYDHIVDYADNPVHEPSNLALLCPNHHTEKTAGRLSRQRVAEARLTPFNAAKDKTTAHRIEPSRELEVWIGSNQAYVAADAVEYPVLWINGQTFLTIHREGASFSFSAILTDEAGRRLLAVDRGELTVSTGVWDYRYEAKSLSIRMATAKSFLRQRSRIPW